MNEQGNEPGSGEGEKQRVVKMLDDKEKERLFEVGDGSGEEDGIGGCMGDQTDNWARGSLGYRLTKGLRLFRALSLVAGRREPCSGRQVPYGTEQYATPAQATRRLVWYVCGLCGISCDRG